MLSEGKKEFHVIGLNKTLQAFSIFLKRVIR